MMPLVTSAPVFGIGAIGEKYVANGGWFYVILLALAAAPAWIFKNYMPMHGSPTGSTIMNLCAYFRLTLPGFIGIAVGVGIFLALQPVVKGKPALLILRIVVVAIVACLVAGTSLYFLAGKAIQTKLKAQSIIFKNKHTFWFTILYIMTFGSFIGYSSAFPLIIKNVFGYLPNGDKNPNAPAPGTFAWMGAFVGSLSRIVGGFASDKLGRQGGAIVTHWGTIIEVVATVLAGVFTGLAMNADTPETYFAPFLISFLFLFGSTGSSNGSTFRQMSVSFPPEEAGPVLGWTSAIAAYGAAIFPACFGAGVEGDFVDKVFYFLASYYFICLIVNYWFYYRKNAEMPC
jgi:NNP family nitrate/nitrite transporter-like MFS transporter